MAEKYEFMSCGWLNKLEELLRGLVEQNKAQLYDVAFSINEVYTNPPEYIAVEHEGKPVAFYFRIADGELEFGKGELSDASIKIVAPYDKIKPFARTLKAEDSTYDARFMQVFTNGAANGTASIESNGTFLPEVLNTLHDLIAAHTA